MKKSVILYLIIVQLFLLASCKQSTNNLLIIVPSGTPSLIIANTINDDFYVRSQKEKYKLKYDIVNGSDPLLAAFTSKSHDIIFAPTNLGANIYNKNSNYVLIGVPIWGNNYIISNLDQNIKSFSDLNNKKLLGFGRMSTPDAILQIVLSNYNLKDSVKVEYVLDVSTAMSYFLNNKEPIVMTAEPLLSKAINQSQVSIINLQKEWEKITGYNGYPQVGIFIKKEHINNLSLIQNYMKLINEEINFINNEADNFSKIAVLADETFALIGQKAIEESIPNCNYRLEYIYDIREEVEYYFSVLLEFNPKLIGGEMPNDEFYWKNENP